MTRLEQLADRGISFRLVSEELGERRFGDDESPWVVVVDPIDGSLNAKRCLPFYCISIAFADGPTVDDVRFGYVLDLGSGEEWVATAGEGATVNGRPLGGVRPKAAARHRGLRGHQRRPDRGRVRPARRPRRPHPRAGRAGAGAVPAGRRTAGRRGLAEAVTVGRHRRRSADRARGRCPHRDARRRRRCRSTCPRAHTWWRRATGRWPTRCLAAALAVSRRTIARLTSDSAFSSLPQIL